jgi:hypothetical protein
MLTEKGTEIRNILFRKDSHYIVLNVNHIFFNDGTRALRLALDYILFKIKIFKRCLFIEQ